MSLERVKTFAELVKLVQDIWIAHSDRKKQQRDERTAQRAKEMEDEVQRLKQPQQRCYCGKHTTNLVEVRGELLCGIYCRRRPKGMAT